jgi:alkylated DNA repair dioxygenase AlkB
MDYHYTGRVNEALPVPALLEPFLSWGATLDSRLNGVLLNWYDAEKKHYIGAHRDSTVQMIEGCPILTISLGATRNFRFRPWKGIPPSATWILWSPMAA